MCQIGELDLSLNLRKDAEFRAELMECLENAALQRSESSLN